jgi:hypothetical protein
MVTMLNRQDPSEDFLDMTLNELLAEWTNAKRGFDQALIQKTETDRIFVAAANKLNALERVVKKVQRRAVVARRSEAKSLLRTA